MAARSAISRPKRAPGAKNPGGARCDFRGDSAIRRLLPEAVVKAGELPLGFPFSSLQGADLPAKVHRNPAPPEPFKQILFSMTLC
jgi:hypothetical protein